MRTSRDQNRHRAFPITTHGVALSAGIQGKSEFTVAYVVAEPNRLRNQTGIPAPQNTNVIESKKKALR
jgi:hypothetical protein